MTFPRNLVIALSFLIAILNTLAKANDVYIAQGASGSADGSSCASPYAYSYFNSSSNWTSGTPSGTQIGPGTTVHICGTITAPQSATDTILTFQGGGTSGNPVTLKFEIGAAIISPAFHEGIQDFHNYTVIDGGTNGIIQNTANGTGKTYNQGSQSVNIGGSNITVQNLTIQNICLRNAGDDPNSQVCASGSWGSTGITCNPANGSLGCKNILVTRNTLIKPGDTGIEYDPNNGDTNITISNNTISGVDWAFTAISTSGSWSTSGLYITGNDFSCTAGAACIWDDPQDAWHHNGIIMFPGAAGSGLTQTMNNVVIANNYIHDFQSSTNTSVCGSSSGCVTADIFIDPGYNGSLPGLQIYNNVLVENPSFTGPANGGIAVGNSNSVSYTAFVYNNTAVSCGRSGFALDYSGQKGENNIIASCTNSFWSDTTPSGLTVDYNDYYNPSQATAVINGGTPTYSTLANWQSASTGVCSGGCDAHSISTNPSLNADYTLSSGSPARGAGVNLTSLGIAGLNQGAPQYFGVNYACGTGCIARPSSGPWDMGAYPGSGSSVSGPQPPTGLTATVN